MNDGIMARDLSGAQTIAYAGRESDRYDKEADAARVARNERHSALHAATDAVRAGVHVGPAEFIDFVEELRTYVNDGPKQDEPEG